MDRLVVNPGRKHLERLKELANLINTLKMQMQMTEAMLTDTAVHYKDIQVQTSGAKDLIGEKAPEVVELQIQCDEYIRELTKEQTTTLLIIKSMNLRHQELIILHFMQNKTIEATAEEMEKSYTWTWTELQKAIDEFEEKFQKKEKVYRSV